MKGRKTGGRQKGTLNKSNAELKLHAQQYSTEAIDQLARLAGLVRDKHGNPVGQAESEQTRAYCCNVILDRAHGKPTQPIANDDDNPFRMLMESLDGRTRGVPSMYAKQEAERPTSH